jgi:hypothetical protein
MRLEGAVSLELLIVQTLSLLKTKKNELENNFTAIPLSTGKTLDVLNSVVIYGAKVTMNYNRSKTF